MPRRPKLEPLLAAKKNKDVKDVKDARRVLVDRALQKQSLKQYEARFERMETFRKAVDVPEWTLDLFTRWLWQMKEAKYSDSEGYRAALIHCLEARGRDVTCLKCSQVVKMSQGFTLQNKISRKPIGAITEAMLRQLCKWLREKGEKPLAVLAAVIYFTQGRGEEVMRMRKGDIQPDESQKLFLWFVRNDKRCKRGNGYTKTTEKLIPGNIVDLVNIVSKAKHAGDEIFDKENGYSLARLGKRIREASEELHWPKEVKFGGPHGLRHGGTQALLERARETVATGMANQSPSTLKHYAKRNKSK